MATRIICDDSSSAHSTISVHPKSTPSSNSHCHRRRLLRRLRERLHLPPLDGSSLTEDPNSVQGNRPTVIRVGTVSSCASSTIRSRASGGGGTWRMVDELFRRNGAGTISIASTPTCVSTISSTKSSRSNKTIIYDDRWLQVEKPNYCTVVTVVDNGEQQERTEGQRGTVITVNYTDDNIMEEDNAGTSNSIETRIGNPSEPCDNSKGRECGEENAMGRLDAPRAGYQFYPATMATQQHVTQFTSGPVPGAPCDVLNHPDDTGVNLRFPICDDHQTLAPEDLPRLYDGNGWNVVGTPMSVEGSQEEPKGCCGTGRDSQARLACWFVAIISLIGISCVIAGIVMGALIVSGSTRLTLCLLMIGVGLVLVTVSGIAWRLTTFDRSDDTIFGCLRSACSCGTRGSRSFSAGHSPGQLDRTSSARRYSRVRSLHPSGFGHCSPPPPHPPPPPPPNFAIPPEFIWRPPPPSYYAAVQEERIRNAMQYHQSSVGSPPPTYRSRIGADLTQRPSAAELAGLSAGITVRSCDGINEEGPSRSTGLDSRETLGPPFGGCVLAPEPVQQDEAASLVLNEQLQYGSIQTDPCLVSDPALDRVADIVGLRLPMRRPVGPFPALWLPPHLPHTHFPGPMLTARHAHPMQMRSESEQTHRPSAR